MNPRIHNHSWLFKLPIMRGYNGITLGKHLFFKGTPSIRTLSHEFVHLEQQARLGTIRFYLAYFMYFLKGMLIYRNLDMAYRLNPLEIEAYAREEKNDSQAFRY